MDNYKLTTWEVASTLAIVTLTPVLLSYPQYNAKTYGTAYMLHSIYMAIVMFIIFWIGLKLYKPFVGKDILDVAEMLGGKKLKIISGILFLSYLILIVIFTMQEFGEDIEKVMFTHSTNSEINIMFAIAMAVLAYFGMKGAFKFGSYLFPIIVIGFILVFLSLFSRIDVLNLTPILGTGADKVFLSGVKEVGIYSSLFALLFVPPMVKNIKKASYCSIASTSFFIIFSAFLLSTIIPYPSLTQKSFAIFELTRYIGFGRFFQRLEAVFTFLWIMTCFIFIGVALIFIIYILKKSFNLKYANRLIPCIALILYTCSDIIPNYYIATKIREFLYIVISPCILLILPIILISLCRLKISGRKERSCQE